MTDVILPTIDTDIIKATEDDPSDFINNLSLQETQAVKTSSEPLPTDNVNDFINNLPSHETSSVKNEGEDDAATFNEQMGIQPDRNTPNAIRPWMENHEFILVKSIEEVNTIIDECIQRGFCALDLETEGLDTRINWKDGKPETVHKIVGYCISYDGIKGFYIPVRHNPKDSGPNLNLDVVAVETAITRLCQAAIPEASPEEKAKDPLSYRNGKSKVIIAFWHAQFDHEMLFPVTGIDWWHPDAFEDGQLACFVNNTEELVGLKEQAKKLKDVKGNPYDMIKLQELFFQRQKGGFRFNTLSPDEVGVLRYACSDAICTYLLSKLPSIIPHCLEHHRFTYRLEKQVSNVLRVLERNRVMVDRAAIKNILEEEIIHRDTLLDKIKKIAQAKNWKDFNPSSPKQVSDFLFGSLPLGLDISPKPEKTQTGQYKTSIETLQELSTLPGSPAILKDIVEFREVEKLITTYLTNLNENPDANNELRFGFNAHGAATGRFSAPAGKPDQGFSGIPIHGIPKEGKMRRIFKARPGYVMVKADYAGEELRIAANVSKEPIWIKEFLTGTGDLHTITARAFYKKEDVTKAERDGGKRANFGLLYGGGPAAIVRAIGCSITDAIEHKKSFDKAVPTFAKWIREQHKAVKSHLGVTTAFGRWLVISEANDPDKGKRAACERHAINYQIQGAGADIMKIVMVLLHKQFHQKGWLRIGGDDSIRMLLTVHDEIDFEIKYERVLDAIPLIVNVMESPWTLARPKWEVPLVVEPLIGYNWASGYEVRRDNPNHAIKSDEVAINGFVYKTTRKPYHDDEPLNYNEVKEEIADKDGKTKIIYRLVDAPWLTVMPKSESEAPKSEAPKSEALKSEAPKSEAPKSEAPKSEAPKEERVLVLHIGRLTEKSIGQVMTSIWNSTGLEVEQTPDCVLHLMDISGETTLISPDLRIRVNEEVFVEKLSEYDLLPTEEDAK